MHAGGYTGLYGQIVELGRDARGAEERERAFMQLRLNICAHKFRRKFTFKK